MNISTRSPTIFNAKATPFYDPGMAPSELIALEVVVQTYSLEDVAT